MVRNRIKRKSTAFPQGSLAMLNKTVSRRLIDGGEFSAIVGSVLGLMGGVYSGIDNLVISGENWKRTSHVESTKALFGLDRPDSSLMKSRLEWKMSLSERISTETLARLLNAGAIEKRAPRMEAFLRALGLGNDKLGVEKGKLERFEVFSEVPAYERRIDLKVVWKDAKNRERVLIIEAKFEHVITDGQLSFYRDSTKMCHPRARRFLLILALQEDAMSTVNIRRDGKWLFCSWRDLWLRFETTRPVEDNISLQLFLHALWRRIGQLNHKDCHAAL